MVKFGVIAASVAAYATPMRAPLAAAVVADHGNANSSTGGAAGIAHSRMRVIEIDDRVEWDQLVNAHRGHPLQLWGWGELKATGPWTPRRLAISGPNGSAVAQVLVRHLPVPFRALSYVPRGPAVGRDGIGDPALRVAAMQAIAEWCRVNVGGIAVEFEPDWPIGTELPGLAVQPARNTILYPHTLILDLTKGSDELMKALRKSTRYDIRKAARTGLETRRVTDRNEIRKVLDVYHETAERAGFVLHDDDYYLDLQKAFGDNSRLIVALDREGNPASFAWSIVSAETGFMLYGGRNQIGHKLRANPAVYWAAIMDAMALGCKRYDLNGLLGEGITTFKKSFAKHEDMLIGTLDVPINPLLYATWERALPLAKRTLRAVRERDLKLLKSDPTAAQ